MKIITFLFYLEIRYQIPCSNMRTSYLQSRIFLMNPSLDIKRKPYYNRYLSAYHVFVYYIKEYSLVIFVYILLHVILCMSEIIISFFGRTSLPWLSISADVWQDNLAGERFRSQRRATL